MLYNSKNAVTLCKLCIIAFFELARIESAAVSTVPVPAPQFKRYSAGKSIQNINIVLLHSPSPCPPAYGNINLYINLPAL